MKASKDHRALLAITALLAALGGWVYASSYIYDSNDQLLNVTNTNGEQVAYTYDEAGNILSILVLSNAPTYYDADADLLPDWWEIANFTNLWQAPTDDFDGDGSSDADEYGAGTSPTNAASVFRIASVQNVSTSKFLVRWSSVTNKLYSVWRGTNTLAGLTARTNDVRATPPLNVYTDSVPALPRAYYQIRVQP